MTEETSDVLKGFQLDSQTLTCKNLKILRYLQVYCERQ